MIGLLLAAIALFASANPAPAADAVLVNLAADRVPAIAAAAREAGLDLKGSGAADPSLSGRVLIWEARGGGGGEVTPEAAQHTGEWVRQGGRLLLTLSEQPGTGPMRLSFLLPTTGWQTQAQAGEGARKTGGAAVVDFDPEFFPAAADGGAEKLKRKMELPYFYPIRPFSAVERGEGRYERFERMIPYVELAVPAGHSFWTRPLIDRDWRVRARGDDLGRTPVLLTGRYGAGRVAIFASSAAAAGPDAAPFWASVLRWLNADDGGAAATGARQATPASVPTPSWEVDGAHRLLRVTVRNPGAEPLALRVLARLRTWERAIVGDVEREVTAPPHGQAVAELPLPAPTAINYQALDDRDAFDVRLGVLSADGTTVLHETRIPADVRPPLRLAVCTDDVRAVEYPFKAPGPQSLPFPTRMGTMLAAYAYLPGGTVNVDVTLANGLRDIAPLAEARDETDPEHPNPSAAALSDEAAHAEQGAGTDKITAYGVWAGQAGRENVLSFTFPVPVTVAAVTLVGSADNYRNYLTHNPGAEVIEVDGQHVATAIDVDRRFAAESGAVRLAFPPRQATVVRVRLPWAAAQVPLPDGPRRREAPWLGEVRIDGSTTPLPPARHGTLSLVLHDALAGDAPGTAAPPERREVDVPPGEERHVRFTFPVPKGDNSDAARFYRVEASFEGQEAAAPFVAIRPAHPLEPLRDLKPPTAPDLGFIVTRGFRNVFDTGTGTQEIGASWGTPDDLVWAYAHQMKQLGKNARTRADRLYVSESDMRHYSTPWRSLPDGEYFYDIAPSLLVERMKQDRRWRDSSVAILAHSDRWDTAPDVDALHGWEDFVEFDQYLRDAGLPGLKGRTRQEIAAEIHGGYEHRWQAWHLERYVRAVRNLREAFAAEGKRLVITAQGSPLVPGKYEAELTGTIRGQSDDSTWGMAEESVPLTTGRQMGVMAFNPGWAMSTLLQWGFDSAVLNNPHWHNPVGTTEPSRRHQYDRAWRGVVGRDGTYHSMHAYGYNTNTGDPYTMTANDWQQWWRVEERESLIAPDGPIGAGVVISTARFADPDRASFSGSGGWGAGEADEQARAVAKAVRRLHESGVSVPFSANAAALDKWTGTAPLVLLDVDLWSDDELAALRKLKARGVRMVAFTSKAGAVPPAAAAELFGVAPGGSAAAGSKAGELAGRPLVASPGSLFAAVAAEDLTASQARSLTPLLSKQLQVPVVFPAGTAGYGFTSQGLSFLVVEDWAEQGRDVSVRLRAAPGATAARAADVNAHRPLPVRREGEDWVIDLPLRPGDGVLVAVEEVKP